MSVINNHEVCYDAFISYRHSELDKFVAEELHKQLETFKIPKKIAEKCKKKKISRIFRDKDELPITSNLADPIINALRMSEFLIVICSPRLKESLWCKREIENFIAMHGQDKVLAVLVEGEPSESFPQELLYREKTVVAQNGEVQVVREPIEPLAADVRGKNKKDIKKLMKSEVLRLLASMLQCNYDDLKQRHKERKMHRMLALAAVVGAVGISFGTVSTIMALQIHNQKEQIDRQYWEALEINAKISSDNALELLEIGDRIGAINMARELLPDNLENQDIPYTPEAYYALTQSIYPYAAGDILKPVFRIKENAQIDEMILAHDRNKLAVRTKYDKLTVWDIPGKEKCLELDLNKITDYSVYSEGVTFVGADKLAFLTYEGILIIDINDNPAGEIRKRISCDEYSYPRKLLSNAEGTYIVAVFEKDICVYDVKTGQLLSTYHAPENLEVMSGHVTFRGNNQLIFAYGTSTLSEVKSDFKIQLADLEQGSILKEFTVPYGRLAQIDAGKDSLFVAVNGDTKELISIFDTVDDAILYCFDLTSGAKRWEYQAKEEFINRIVIPYEGYDCFLFESYAQITALEHKTGELIGTFGFSSSIVNIFPLQNPDSYTVFTRDGARINFIPEQNYNVENMGTFIPGTNNMKQIEWGNNFFVALPYMSKELIVYDWYRDKEAKEVLEFEDSVLDFAVSEDEKYSAVELYGYQLLVLDNETKEILGTTVCESYSDGLHFIDNDTIQRISGDEVFLYNLNGELLKQYPLGEDYLSVDGVSLDGKYAFADNYEYLYAINCATKQVEGKLAKDQCEYNAECQYYFNNNGDKCVIMDKSAGRCRSYDVKQGTLLATIDINATYIENVCFSEDDRYVYFVYEDGRVEQYISQTMERKCEVDKLDSITDVIIEKVQNGEKKYYFCHSSGAYVLGEYDGELKVEQSIPLLEAAMISRGEYWIVDYKTLMVLPIYTYEEILGKADEICYDNTLWNNN